MSTVIAQPEALAAGARELQAITSAMAAANAATAAPTTQITPAGADMVSVMTATAFAAHADLYQQVSARATATRQMLETVLSISAGTYDATEAANAAAVSVS
ncbi:PE family protein [Mycolicibacter nonchromogenicus]|uniref:PE family protein n=1 Tax=Mycolicibacter nonchromogenicus TaxID=1782 RepID=A0A1X1ZJC3_MYCNO|nr:PE family protein [Mycolicibacter nonchromogenicus]ORW23463.1 PE family protein [Mycolicibacter nonchromogenicus]